MRPRWCHHGGVRKSFVLSLAAAALVISGCGSQGSPAPAAHGKDPASASPASSSSPSPSPTASPTGPVGKMGTCNLLFHGHSPLISRTMRMALKAEQGKASDPAVVESTAADLRQVAARTRAKWRGDVLAVAKTLPEVADGSYAKSEYKTFQSAHHALVSHCTVFVD